MLIGLLVEPNSQSYKKLLSKNRNAASINLCVSNSNLPELVDFINAGTISGLQGNCQAVFMTGSWSDYIQFIYFYFF